MAKAGPKTTTAMTDAEADDLAQRIGRNVRFKVAGRRVLDGKGNHLDVVDLQTGFRHRIHSQEHWRQIFNEMVLLVEGAWEDVTIAAIAQLEQEEEKLGGRERLSRQRKMLLAKQRRALVNALEHVQATSEQMASSGKGAHPPQRRARGTGTIHQTESGWWIGYLPNSNVKPVYGRSYGECEGKLNRLMAGDESVVHGGGQHVKPGTIVLNKRSKSGRLTGQFRWKGKQYTVSAGSYEECREKMDKLKAAVGFDPTAMVFRSSRDKAVIGATHA